MAICELDLGKRNRCDTNILNPELNITNNSMKQY